MIDAIIVTACGCSRRQRVPEPPPLEWVYALQTDVAALSFSRVEPRLDLTEFRGHRRTFRLHGRNHIGVPIYREVVGAEDRPSYGQPFVEPAQDEKEIVAQIARCAHVDALKDQQSFLLEHSGRASLLVADKASGLTIRAEYISPVWEMACDNARFWLAAADEMRRLAWEGRDGET